MLSDSNFSRRLWVNAAFLVCGTISSPIQLGTNNALAEALPPSVVSRIVFASDRDGNFEIYSIMPDGQSLKRLTNNAATDQKPVWNHDYSKIAFASNRDGNFELYSLNVLNGEPDGLPVRLTDNVAQDTEPSWSPDGGQVVFTSDRSGQRDIYVLDVATKNIRKLTNRPNNDNSSPSWSPKGDKIAFQSQVKDTGQARSGIPSYIYTVNTNGEEVQKVTSGFFDASPNWHPNGGKIVFWRSGPFLLNVDLKTGTETILSPEGYSDPSYSPNGEQIVCVRSFSEGELENEFTNTEIFVLDAIGSTGDLKRLTTNPSQDQAPNWSK